VFVTKKLWHGNCSTAISLPQEQVALMQSDNEITQLASEIVSYLDHHPQAADSAKGIAQWWLKRQRLSIAVDNVSLALELLCHEGKIKKNRSASGDVVYSRTDDTGR